MEGKLGLDELGKPPMCHWIVNAIVGFFVPPLGHFLSRPSDVKSLSFVGVTGVCVACWVLNMIPFLRSLLSLLTWPVLTVLGIYAIFVAFVSEKRNPRPTKPPSSGVLSMERGGGSLHV